MTDEKQFKMNLKFYEEGKWTGNVCVAAYRAQYPDELESMLLKLQLGNLQWFLDNMHHPETSDPVQDAMASLRCGQSSVWSKIVLDKEGKPLCDFSPFFDRPGEVKTVTDFFTEHEIKTGSGINWGNFSGIPEELVAEFKLICKEDNTQYDIRKTEDGTYSGRWHY